MNKKRFEQLLESIREGGEILRGERGPSRVFVREIPHDARKPPEITWAICLTDDEPELLIPMKLYRIEIWDSEMARVIDEEGEVLICPAPYFAPVNLPCEVIEALEAHGYVKAA